MKKYFDALLKEEFLYEGENLTLQGIMEEEATKFKNFFRAQEKFQVLRWFFLPFKIKIKELSFYPFHASKSNEEMEDLEIIKLLFL